MTVDDLRSGFVPDNADELWALLLEHIADVICEAGAGFAVEVEGGMDTQREQLFHFVIEFGDGGDDAFVAVPFECFSGVQVGAVFGHGKNDEMDPLLELHTFPEIGVRRVCQHDVASGAPMRFNLCCVTIEANHTPREAPLNSL